MEQLNGFYSYNGFEEPEHLADTLTELLEKVVISHEYIVASVNGTDDFKYHVSDLLDWLEITPEEVTTDHKEDFDGLLYDYGIWWNPTIEELAEFNVSVGLNKDVYISGLFYEMASDVEEIELTDYID